MKKYKDYRVGEYLNALSKKTPVPGGGSAAALTAATGAALVSMVTQYSIGKSESKQVNAKLRSILKQSEQMRKRLIELVDLDAKAYLKVVRARGASEKIKKSALKEAARIPAEVSRLCYKMTRLTPFLVEKGNQNLMSDMIVAIDMLFAAFNSARTNVEANC